MQFLLNVCLLSFHGVFSLRLQRWTYPGTFNKKEYQCTKSQPIMVGGGSDEKDVCMDNWDAIQLKHKGQPCVAYDLGVRTAASFALTAMNKLGCVVRAYDPSPTTSQWYDTSKDPDVLKLKDAEKKGIYKLNKEAVSEKDGELELFAYNWQQISVFKANGETQGEQKKFVVPARSWTKMLEVNGDTFVDILKVDIEGSEFAFLKGMFDQGCPQIEHLLFEWHSTNFDKTLGSPPEVKEFENKFEKCGYKKWDYHGFWAADPTAEEKFKIDKTYYGHSSYCLTCWKQL